LWLVATSLAVAILASYAALNLVANVTAARRRRASMLWLAGSAIAMGIGIWSMPATPSTWSAASA
jgi:NO-binding membrane sensor protein with MHYT domain